MGFAMEALLQKPEVKKAFGKNSSSDQKLAEKYAGALGKMGHKKGGTVSSASARADGCCVKGKTKGKMY
jgi:hypothetical protein